MRNTMRIVALIFTTWAGTGCALQAQHVAPATREACAAAAQKAAAEPQSDDFRWAFTFGGLPRCGDTGAVAIAGALRRSGAIADAGLLNNLVVQASSSRHPAILQAALDLAADRTAPAPVRVAGMQVALLQHDNRVALMGSLTELSTTTMGVFCEYDYLLHAHYASARPLPAGHRERIVSVMREIAADASEPQPLRDLAGCVARKVSETRR